MSEKEVINQLRQSIGEELVSRVSTTKARRIFIDIDIKGLKEAIQFLKGEGYTHLSAITGLETDDGIDLLYHLDKDGMMLTLRVKLPLNEAVAPTISDTIPGAVLYEREIYDLLGVKFEGHQNLTRLVLPDEWPEHIHPLRKQRRIDETFS
ncbi:MAG: NADH-quinone oxidoreductase subunit C [Halobacteria archaeon]